MGKGKKNPNRFDITLPGFEARMCKWLVDHDHTGSPRVLMMQLLHMRMTKLKKSERPPWYEEG